uniref:Uncharacterized protein n=1 Tax=Branchiostoma floridae TaxID=7739 RepID=C3YPV5_BRAFL|eukprot:XP_002601581.1 hypothetical protein BRAFLDRAFT_85851 [Branchiostoma floridae]
MYRHTRSQVHRAAVHSARNAVKTALHYNSYCRRLARQGAPPNVETGWCKKPPYHRCYRTAQPSADLAGISRSGSGDQRSISRLYKEHGTCMWCCGTYLLSLEKAICVETGNKARLRVTADIGVSGTESAGFPLGDYQNTANKLAGWLFLVGRYTYREMSCGVGRELV